MNTIKIPFRGKGHKVSYKLETIDLSMTEIPFINVYSVFIDDPELQEIAGDHFTMLHNINQNVLPVFAINQPGNIEESNLKKTIAQQIMNNPNK